MNKDAVFESALFKWGLQSQLDISVEECAELIQAISKIKRFGETDENIESLISEIADVEIICAQLSYIYGRDRVNAAASFKFERLKKRITGEHSEDLYL